MNTFKFLIAGVMLAFGTAVSAATVLPPLTIDFAYAGFDGGDFDGTSVAGEVSGSITLDQIVIGGGNELYTGEYALTGGVLTFDTAADGSVLVFLA